MITETLTWHDAETSKPDAEITVLLWFSDCLEYATGWWDGEEWHSCVDGCEVEGVTHWAEPEGPTP
ncbi:MAG: hypothetical protein AB3X44_16115 [Leptothrix sp. (in: b-proteobacteria)]